MCDSPLRRPAGLPVCLPACLAVWQIAARVGGPDGDSTHPVSVDKIMEVNSGFVIGDNVWLWRADHTASGSTVPSECVVRNGLTVTGDDVTMYGLAVEHVLEDLVQWSGERGAWPACLPGRKWPQRLGWQQVGGRGDAGWLCGVGVVPGTAGCGWMVVPGWVELRWAGLGCGAAKRMLATAARVSRWWGGVGERRAASCGGGCVCLRQLFDFGSHAPDRTHLLFSVGAAIRCDAAIVRRPQVGCTGAGEVVCCGCG
jgi:hypothetical protein